MRSIRSRPIGGRPRFPLGVPRGRIDYMNAPDALGFLVF